MKTFLQATADTKYQQTKNLIKVVFYPNTILFSRNLYKSLFTQKSVRAVHSCDSSELDSLYSIQRKNRHISTATELTNALAYVRNGVQGLTPKPFFAIVNGAPVFRYPDDAFTQIGLAGRRFTIFSPSKINFIARSADGPTEKLIKLISVIQKATQKQTVSFFKSIRDDFYALVNDQQQYSYNHKLGLKSQIDEIILGREAYSNVSYIVRFLSEMKQNKNTMIAGGAHHLHKQIIGFMINLLRKKERVTQKIFSKYSYIVQQIFYMEDSQRNYYNQVVLTKVQIEIVLVNTSYPGWEAHENNIRVRGLVLQHMNQTSIVRYLESKL